MGQQLGGLHKSGGKGTSLFLERIKQLNCQGAAGKHPRRWHPPPPNAATGHPRGHDLEEKLTSNFPFCWKKWIPQPPLLQSLGLICEGGWFYLSLLCSHPQY